MPAELLRKASKQKGIQIMEELSNLVINQEIAYTDGFSDSDLDEGSYGIDFIHSNSKHESHSIPKGKIFSNHACEFIAIKRALDIHRSMSFESSYGILLLTDSRSVLQAISKSNFQLTTK